MYQNSIYKNDQHINSNSKQRIVFIQEGNNHKLITSYFKLIECWKIYEGKNNKSMAYCLKWCNYNQIDWNQLETMKCIVKQQIYIQQVNHVQNILQTFCNKNSLYRILKDNQKTEILENFPETYVLNDQSIEFSQIEKQFLNTTHNGTWILKPCYQNRGKGIKLISNIESYKLSLSIQKNKCSEISNNDTHIIQKYIDNPLLIENKKFDIRCYVIILSTYPQFVLFHHGYVRRSIIQFQKFENNSNLQQIIHLTNQAIQQNHPDYNKLKEDTIWSMQQFENYFKHFGSQKIDELYLKIFKMLKNTLEIGLHNIPKSSDCFEILGCDIMIDDKFKPYLIEFNCSPALACDTKTQKQIIPKVINDTLNLVLKLSEDRNNFFKKLQSGKIELNQFIILINQTDKKTELLFFKTIFPQDQEVDDQKKLQSFLKKEIQFQNKNNSTSSQTQRIQIVRKSHVNLRALKSYFPQQNKIYQDELNQQYDFTQDDEHSIQETFNKLKGSKNLVAFIDCLLYHNKIRCHLSFFKVALQKYFSYFTTQQQNIIYNKICVKNNKDEIDIQDFLSKFYQKKDIQKKNESIKNSSQECFEKYFQMILKVTQKYSINNQNIFKSLDHDNDGILSLQDLNQSFKLMKINIQSQEIFLILDYLGHDNNGIIKFDQFNQKIKLMNSNSDKTQTLIFNFNQSIPSKSNTPHPKNLFQKLIQSISKATNQKETFQLIDQDKDGLISREDFQKSLSTLNLPQYTNINMIFDSIDVNREGFIDSKKFDQAMSLQ